ncbi:membrane protein [Klebsiella phage Sin4]|uniref:Uncharacterized protein n=1 Tax=Klebsiella phage Sin4 TaxID=2580406 RepID=A0A5B9N3R1_9CAUD|nr:membrane protein [Klebsiella phage Sin4]QEG07099.1 hypothetical protein CPT_Sin4_072 [Klebsiella phage Sin4]
MKFIILMMLTVLCMSGTGGFIFAVMLLVVAGIIDIRHHHVMTDLRLNRLINDLKIACENIEIKVVKK